MQMETDDPRTSLIKELDALSMDLDEHAKPGSLNDRWAQLVRRATRHIARLEEKAAQCPEVPDNIEQAYIDGYSAGGICCCPHRAGDRRHGCPWYQKRRRGVENDADKVAGEVNFLLAVYFILPTHSARCRVIVQTESHGGDKK